MDSPRRIPRSVLDRVVRLSRIDLRPDARVALPDELAKILRIMDQLQPLDTGEVPPTSYPHALENRPREDRCRPGLSPSEALRNAPEVAGGSLFTTPRVVDE